MAVACAHLNRIAFRPDGKLLATGSAAGTIHLWDAATLQARGVLTGHGGWVNDVAFSPDGRLLLSAGQDRTLRLWDVEKGTEQRRFDGHTASVRLAFSRDGRRALSGGWDGDNSVRW